MSDWKEGLPDELKVNPALKDFKDVTSLAESYVQTKHLVGSSIRPPGPDAGPDAIVEFTKKLGEKIPGLRYRPAQEWEELEAPADPKAYVAGLQVPEGVTFDQEKFMAAAKELGLTKAQAKKFAEAEFQRQAAGREAAQLADKALRVELGMAYDQRVAAARATAVKMGMPEAEAASMGADQLKRWMNVAQRFGGEGRELGTQGPGASSGALTPEEAQAQIAEITRRPSYFNPRANPTEHQQLRQKVQQLLPQAFPQDFQAA